MRDPNNWSPIHQGQQRHVWLVSALCSVFLAQCGPKQPPLPIESLPIGSCIAAEGQSDWIRLPFPNSIFRPGSIVHAGECNAQWLGHISDCEVPADVLETKFGYIGDWRQQTSRSYGANALLDVPGIGKGAEFGTINRVEVTEEDIRTESLNVIKLERWIAEGPNTLDLTCLRRLQRPDTFLIGESVRIGNAKYTLYDETGIQIGRPKAAEAISVVEANAHVTMQGNGELVLSAPVYTHIKNLQPTWDAETDTRFFRNAMPPWSGMGREPAAINLTGDELFLAITSGQQRKKIG